MCDKTERQELVDAIIADIKHLGDQYVKDQMSVEVFISSAELILHGLLLDLCLAKQHNETQFWVNVGERNKT